MRLAALALLLGACNAEPDHWEFRSTHRGGPNDGTTIVAVWVSDSPADDLDRVLVVVDRVDLDGITLATSRQALDLLTLRNGRRALVAETAVQPGVYHRLRLHLAPAGHSVERGGVVHALDVDDRIVELDGPFLLGANERIDLQADFNVRLSVREEGGQWRLAPDLALFGASDRATIAGVVTDPGGAPIAGATVSAQAGLDEALSTRSDPDGTFRLGPLPAGTYTLVATAPGRAPAFEHAVRVTEGTSDGHALRLPAAVPGAIAGDGPAAPGLTARLYRDGSLVAWSAVDPATGAFAFPDVAPGAYDVQLWDDRGPRATRAVVVDPDGIAPVTLR